MIPAMTSNAPQTRWLVVWLAIGAGIVCGLQVGKAPPMIGGIRDSLSLDLVGAGFYMSAINAVSVFFGIMAGVFADRIGRRRAVALGLIAVVAGNVLGAAAETASLLYLSRLFDAAGFVAIVTAVPGLVSEVTAERDIRTALSAWSIYMPCGFSLMMAAAPLLADPSDWRLIWWLNAALVALYFLLFLGVTRGTGGRPPTARTLEGLRAVAVRPGPWLLGVVFMCYAAQWFGVLTWLPTIMEGVGLSAADAGLGVAAVVGANMTGCLGAGVLMRHGLPRWLTLVVCSLVLATLAFGVYDDGLAPAWRLALAAAFSAIGGLIPGTILAGAPLHSPGPAQVGTTNGVIVQCTNLGSLLGPPLVAWVASLAGGDFTAARWLMLAAGLAGAVTALALRGVEQRLLAARASMPA